MGENWVEEAGQMDALMHGRDDREPVDPVDIRLNTEDARRPHLTPAYTEKDCDDD